MARTKKLDFTGVESYTKAAEGIHTAKVLEIEEKTSQGGDDMLQFTFEVTQGESKGCRVFESFVLTDKALWKFKAFLQAVGMKAEGKMKIDLDKLIGKVCNIEVFWDEYNGQTRAKISDFYKVGKTSYKPDDEGAPDLDDDDEDDDDDEGEVVEEPTPAPKKRGRKPKAVKKPEPVDDEDDDDEDDDDEDASEDDEEPVSKRKGKTTKAPAKKATKKAKKAPEPEDDEDDDTDDDDEWEEDD